LLAGGRCPSVRTLVRGEGLFAMALGAMILVGATGLALVRWSFSGQTSPYDVTAERLEMVALARHLAEQYPDAGAWSIHRTAPAGRRALWPAAVVDASRDLAGSPWTLADRAGLIDREGQLLAGYRASPLLVALVSIDRISQPILVDGRTVGSLLVARPRSADDALAVAFLIRQQGRLSVLVGLGLLLATAASLLLAYRIRRPLQALVRGAQAWGEGRFEVRVDAARRDELGDLARAFNALANRLQSAEASRRQWVADTSHELRTPLAVMCAQVEAMQDGVRPASPEHLALLGRHLAGLSRLVDDLQVLALGDAGALTVQLTSVDVAAIAIGLWDGFAPRFAAAGLSMTTGPMQVAFARADAQRLRQVLINLMENCVRHTASAGRVMLSLEVTPERCRIMLDDSAPGVPDEVLHRLGERFFRPDASRHREGGGVGLGLALSGKLMEMQGGELRFAHSPLGGLRAMVSLPRER
jgi:two-component system sensor histidine kinase BaeS